MAILGTIESGIKGLDVAPTNAHLRPSPLSFRIGFGGPGVYSSQAQAPSDIAMAEAEAGRTAVMGRVSYKKWQHKIAGVERSAPGRPEFGMQWRGTDLGYGFTRAKLDQV